MAFKIYNLCDCETTVEFLTGFIGFTGLIAIFVSCQSC
jgi:hypothetical protein